MEIYNKLPEHLQWYCEKMYFTHSVLPDIKDFINDETCNNCACHGFPCIKCAVLKYEGKLGPGYEYGERIMFFIENTCSNVVRNMSAYLTEKPYTPCRLFVFTNHQWEGGKNIELPYKPYKLCIYVNGVWVKCRL